MRPSLALLPLAAAMLAPAAATAQSGPTPPAPTSTFSGLFTSWSGTNRESLRAETETRRVPADASTSIPASSPLDGRSQQSAAALGERVAEVVRRGDCAEGERIAREAGDFPLVRAVRDHCRTRS